MSAMEKLNNKGNLRLLGNTDKQLSSGTNSYYGMFFNLTPKRPLTLRGVQLKQEATCRLRVFYRIGPYESHEQNPSGWIQIMDEENHVLNKEGNMGVALATPLDLALSLEGNTTYGFYFFRNNSCGIHYHSGPNYSTPLSTTNNPDRIIQNEDLQLSVGAYGNSSTIFTSFNPHVMPVFQIFYEVIQCQTPLSDAFGSNSGLIDSVVTEALISQVSSAAALPGKATSGPLHFVLSLTTQIDALASTHKVQNTSWGTWAIEQRKKLNSRMGFGKSRPAITPMSPFARAGVEMLVSTSLVMISSMTATNPALLTQILNIARTTLERYLTILIPAAEQTVRDINNSLKQLTVFLFGLSDDLEASDPNALAARSLCVGLTLAQASLSDVLGMIHRLWVEPNTDYVVGGYLGLVEYAMCPDATEADAEKPGVLTGRATASKLMSILARIASKYGPAANLKDDRLRSFQPLAVDLRESTFEGLRVLVSSLLADFEDAKTEESRYFISRSLESAVLIASVQFYTVYRTGMSLEAGGQNDVLTTGWRDVLFKLKRVNYLEDEAWSVGIRMIASRIVFEGWDYFFASTQSKLEYFLTLSQGDIKDNDKDYDAAQTWFVQANMLNAQRLGDAVTLIPAHSALWLRLIALQIEAVVLSPTVPPPLDLSTDCDTATLTQLQRSAYIHQAAGVIMNKLTFEELEKEATSKTPNSTPPIFMTFCGYAKMVLSLFCKYVDRIEKKLPFLEPLLVTLLSLPLAYRPQAALILTPICMKALHALHPSEESKGMEGKEQKMSESRDLEREKKDTANLSALLHRLCCSFTSVLVAGLPRVAAEIENLQWLSSSLFAGGMESNEYFPDQIPDELRDILDEVDGLSEEKKGPSLEQEFLENVVNCKGSGERLLKILEAREALPVANGSRFGRQAVCAVLAVLLKHSGHLQEAMALGSSTQELPISVAFHMMWKNLGWELMHSVGAVAGGEGAPAAEAFVGRIKERTKFLLALRSLRTVASTGEQKLEAKGGDEDFPAVPKLVRSVSDEVVHLKQLMRQRRYSNSTPLEESEGASQLRREVLGFVKSVPTKELIHTELSDVIHAVGVQRSRAAYRLLGLRYFQQLYLLCTETERVAVLELLTAFSECYSSSTTFSHFYEGIESSGRRFSSILSAAYYSLVKEFFSARTMNMDVEHLLGCCALNACRLPLKVGDVIHLRESGLTEYIRPLLHFPGISPGWLNIPAGKEKAQYIGRRIFTSTGKVKLAGWALFRLLCYRLANLHQRECDELKRLGAPDPTHTIRPVQEFLDLLLGEAQEQIQVLSAMRAWEAERKERKSEVWTCSVCCFLNETGTTQCGICSAAKNDEPVIPEKPSKQQHALFSAETQWLSLFSMDETRQPAKRVTYPSLYELEAYQHQWLFLLLRLAKFPFIVKKLEKEEWMQFFESELFNSHSSEVTRILVMRLLGLIVPHMALTPQTSSLVTKVFTTIGDSQAWQPSEFIALYRNVMSASVERSPLADFAFQFVLSGLTQRSPPKLSAALSVCGAFVETARQGACVLVESVDSPSRGVGVVVSPRTEKKQYRIYWNTGENDFFNEDAVKVVAQVPVEKLPFRKEELSTMLTSLRELARPSDIDAEPCMKAAHALSFLLQKADLAKQCTSLPAPQLLHLGLAATEGTYGLVGLWQTRLGALEAQAALAGYGTSEEVQSNATTASCAAAAAASSSGSGASSSSGSNSRRGSISSGGERKTLTEKDALFEAIRARRPPDPPAKPALHTKLPDLGSFGEGIAYEAKHKKEFLVQSEMTVADVRDPNSKFRVEGNLIAASAFFGELKEVKCWDIRAHTLVFSPEIPLAENFTVAFWAHFDDGNVLYRSLLRGPKDYMVLIENNASHTLGFGPSGSFKGSAFKMPLNTWMFIALTGSRGGEKHFYTCEMENGTMQKHPALTDKLVDTKLEKFGNPSSGAHIASFYSFNKSLQEDEIAKLFQVTHPLAKPETQSGTTTQVCPFPSASFLCSQPVEWTRTPTGIPMCFDAGGSLISARLERSGNLEAGFAQLISELACVANDVKPLEFTIAGRFGSGVVETKGACPRTLLSVVSRHGEAFRVNGSDDLSKLEVTWTTPRENNLQVIRCPPGYHHISLSFQCTTLSLFIDGKEASCRVVPLYELGEVKSDGVEFVASWEVPWEDNGVNDLCVYRYGLQAEQVEYLSNVSLVSVVGVDGTNHRAGLFPFPQLPEAMQAPLPLSFFPLSAANQYAISETPSSMTQWAENIETSSPDDGFALKVSGEITLNVPLSQNLMKSVGVSAPASQSAGSPGSESLCFRVNKTVYFEGIALPHNLFVNGEQTGSWELLSQDGRVLASKSTTAWTVTDASQSLAQQLSLERACMLEADQWYTLLLENSAAKTGNAIWSNGGTVDSPDPSGGTVTWEFRPLSFLGDGSDSLPTCTALMSEPSTSSEPASPGGGWVSGMLKRLQDMRSERKLAAVDRKHLVLTEAEEKKEPRDRGKMSKSQRKRERKRQEDEARAKKLQASQPKPLAPTSTSAPSLLKTPHILWTVRPVEFSYSLAVDLLIDGKEDKPIPFFSPFTPIDTIVYSEEQEEIPPPPPSPSSPLPKQEETEMTIDHLEQYLDALAEAEANPPGPRRVATPRTLASILDNAIARRTSKRASPARSRSKSPESRSLSKGPVSSSSSSSTQANTTSNTMRELSVSTEELKAKVTPQGLLLLSGGRKKWARVAVSVVAVEHVPRDRIPEAPPLVATASQLFNWRPETASTSAPAPSSTTTTTATTTGITTTIIYSTSTATTSATTSFTTTSTDAPLSITATTATTTHTAPTITTATSSTTLTTPPALSIDVNTAKREEKTPDPLMFTVGVTVDGSKVLQFQALGSRTSHKSRFCLFSKLEAGSPNVYIKSYLVGENGSPSSSALVPLPVLTSAVATCSARLCAEGLLPRWAELATQVCSSNIRLASLWSRLSGPRFPLWDSRHEAEAVTLALAQLGYPLAQSRGIATLVHAEDQTLKSTVTVLRRVMKCLALLHGAPRDSHNHPEDLALLVANTVFPAGETSKEDKSMIAESPELVDRPAEDTTVQKMKEPDQPAGTIPEQIVAVQKHLTSFYARDCVLAIIKTLKSTHLPFEIFAESNSPEAGRKFLANFLQVTNLAVWKELAPSLRQVLTSEHSAVKPNQPDLVWTQQCPVSAILLELCLAQLLVVILDGKAVVGDKARGGLQTGALEEGCPLALWLVDMFVEQCYSWHSSVPSPLLGKRLAGALLRVLFCPVQARVALKITNSLSTLLATAQELGWKCPLDPAITASQLSVLLMKRAPLTVDKTSAVLGNLVLCLSAVKSSPSRLSPPDKWPAWMERMFATQTAFDLLLEGKLMEGARSKAYDTLKLTHLKHLTHRLDSITAGKLIPEINRMAEKSKLSAVALCELDVKSFSPDLTRGSVWEDFPAEQYRACFAVLQVINKAVIDVLPHVNFAARPRQSIILDLLHHHRHVIFHNVKIEFSAGLLLSSKVPATESDLSLDRMAALRTRVGDPQPSLAHTNSSIFGQAFRTLRRTAARNFRLGPNERAWKTRLTGMHATDAGGVYRDMLEIMCQEIQGPWLTLLVPCPNQRTAMGSCQDRFVPRSSLTCVDQLAMFEFVGQLFGLAIRTRSLLPLNLPPIIWKKIAGVSVTRIDVDQVDLLGMKILDQLEALSSGSAADFDAGCSELTFESQASDGESRSLCEGGESKTLTFANREEYATLLLDFRLKEFDPQCAAIRRGMGTVVPLSMLALYTWAELETAVCGRGIDTEALALLKTQTIYEGCNPADPHIVLFWQVMESLDENQRSIILAFIWGRSRLPRLAEEYQTKMKITNYKKESGDPNRFFPVSHTCFFHLELPRYTTFAIMKQRLLYASTECTVVDGDGSLQ